MIRDQYLVPAWVTGMVSALICASCSPIRVNLIDQDNFATIANSRMPNNRIGYRFHEHEPMFNGPIPPGLAEAGVDPAAVEQLEKTFAGRPYVTRYVKNLDNREGWVPQQWTFYLVPVADGIDVLLIVETRDKGLNEFYGVQQCFRMSGETNDVWRHAMAKTPAFSEYDLWAEQEKNNVPKSSLSYVLRGGKWEPLPAKKETVGARTPLGVKIDETLTESRLEKMPLVGPYNAEMAAPIDSGLVTRVNRDKTWICGLYWERTSHVTNHHPADCLHSIVNIGGLPPHAKRAVRGKIYWFKGTLDDLVRHWKRDFPNAPY